ncbi:GntR family transcriptional regulator [Nonomuraea sp. NPDC049419]|uniref:GntR family transcriptional regulator n=1 Tax=Nonomuraea sp. NPDC049419 TaxID=3155772 RepID=UPI003422B8DB
MDGKASFPLGPSSLTEALYESVRKRIVNGDIAPGEKLTEIRIANEYSVARPTAKACLERLTALGLLRRTTHKTAVVPKLDEAEIRDLYFSRETVERAAVVALARAGTVPPEAVRAQAAMRAAAGDAAQHGSDQGSHAGAFATQVEADIAFHSALVAAVGSRRLARMHEVILGEVHLTMGQFQAHRTTDPMNVAHEHDDILKAIGDGDPERAQQCLAHHLDQAQGRLLGQLRRERSEEAHT